MCPPIALAAGTWPAAKDSRSSRCGQSWVGPNAARRSSRSDSCLCAMPCRPHCLIPIHPHLMSALEFPPGANDVSLGPALVGQVEHAAHRPERKLMDIMKNHDLCLRLV